MHHFVYSQYSNSNGSGGSGGSTAIALDIALGNCTTGPGANPITIYSSKNFIGNGAILYTDSARTITYDGSNSLFYHNTPTVSIIEMTFNVDSNGLISNITPCSIGSPIGVIQVADCSTTQGTNVFVNIQDNVIQVGKNVTYDNDGSSFLGNNDLYRLVEGGIEQVYSDFDTIDVYPFLIRINNGVITEIIDC